jgi:hypothetical protein
MADFARLAPAGAGLSQAVEDILDQGAALRARLVALRSPFGDGTACDRIVDRVRALTDVGPDALLAEPAR